MRRSSLAQLVGVVGLTALLTLAPTATAAETHWKAPVSGSWTDASRWTAGVPGATSTAIFGEVASDRTFDVIVDGLLTAGELVVTNQRPRAVGAGTGAMLMLNDLRVAGATPDGGPATCTINDVAAVVSGTLRVGDGTEAGAFVCDAGSTLLVSTLHVGGGDGSTLVCRDGGTLYPQSLPSGETWTIGHGSVGAVVVEGGDRRAKEPSSVNGYFVIVGADGGEGTITVKDGGLLNCQSLSVGRGVGETALPGVGRLVVENGGIAMGGWIILGFTGAPSGRPLAYCELASGSTINAKVAVGQNAAPFVAMADRDISISELHLLSARFGPARAEHGSTLTLSKLVVGTQSQVEFIAEADSTVVAESLWLGGELPGFGTDIDPDVGTMRVHGSLTVTGELLSPFGDSDQSLGQLSVEPNGSAEIATAVLGEWGEARWTVEPDASLTVGSFEVGERGRFFLDIASGGLCTIEQSLVVDTAGPAVPPGTRRAEITIDSGGRFEAGELLLGAESILNVEIGAQQRFDGVSTAWAPIVAQECTFKGTCVVRFAADADLTPGSAYVIAEAASIDAASLAVDMAVPGAPPVLLTSDGAYLVATILPPPEALVILGPVVVDVGVPFELTALAWSDGGSSDVSDMVAWSSTGGAAVVQVDLHRFVALGSGAASVDARLGSVLSSHSVLASLPALPALAVVSGQPGLWPNVSNTSLKEILRPSAVSDDGAWVVFTSGATNLVQGPDTANQDVFVKSTIDGSITKVSLPLAQIPGMPNDGNGGGAVATISGDGRWMAYESIDQLVPGGPVRNAIVVDRATDDRIYVTPPQAGNPLNHQSFMPILSRDARYVLFSSNSSQLVPGDTNATMDAFLLERDSGTITRVSQNPDGSQFGAPTRGRAISDDGRYILFSAIAVLPGTEVDFPYRLDRLTGVVEKAAPPAVGGQPTGGVHYVSMSADGDLVAFSAPGDAGFIPEIGPSAYQVYVHRFSTGETCVASVPSSGEWANGSSAGSSLSGDGRYVFFISSSTDLVEGPSQPPVNALFRKDLMTGEVIRLENADGIAYGGMWWEAIAPTFDGSGAAFVSYSNAILEGDDSGSDDVFFAAFARPLQGDLNADGIVDVADLSLLLGDWGGSQFDLDGDGVVGSGDLAFLLARWS